MANKTINDISTLVTSLAAGDLLPAWRAANADTVKIAKSNLIGAVLTGGGTIATGGFTLTVPATGTAALWTAGEAWSPSLTFGGGQVGMNYGHTSFWHQVGPIVFATAYITLTAKGSSTGVALISNLPVAAKNTANLNQPVLLRMNNLTGVSGHLQGFIAPGGTSTDLEFAATGTVVQMTDAHFTNTTDIMLLATYLAA